MKIYKFRSLTNCNSLERVLEILETGKFWCARFWEMNDPMEGIYRIDKCMNYLKIEQTFKEKSNTLICSFSGEDALKQPLMWGYYCDGFKGIALEVEVPDVVVKQVTYTPKIARPSTSVISELVNTILTSKLSYWEHEKEYRFLTDGDSHKQPIGTITSVILGRSYPKGLDNPDVDDRHAQIMDFESRIKAVIVAAGLRDISIKEARFQGGTITIEDYQNKSDSDAG
jgi:hypothetical protein